MTHHDTTPQPGIQMVPAAVSRVADGTVLISVAGQSRGQSTTVVAAVSQLCAEAMSLGMTLVVTVAEADRRRHLSIDPAGTIRETAPPAAEALGYPSTPSHPSVHTGVPAGHVRDEEDQRGWVADYLLTPKPQPRAESKRRWFGR